MYQHAAATAYEHVLRLQNELPGIGSLQQQLHGYLTAISCLELLRQQDVSFTQLQIVGYFRSIISFIISGMPTASNLFHCVQFVPLRPINQLHV